METIEIKWINKNDMKSILPLVHELNSNLSIDLLESRLEDMIKRNYLCLGLYYGKELIGICGIWILNKFYVGKHLEIDNVIISHKFRGLGLGKRLIQEALNFGTTENCKYCELNCYINNTKAQLFWEEEGFTKLGHHMQKKLN